MDYVYDYLPGYYEVGYCTCYSSSEYIFYGISCSGKCMIRNALYGIMV